VGTHTSDRTPTIPAIRGRADSPLQRLIASGKRRGYLTYGQVAERLPDDDDAFSQQVGQVLRLLEKEGIPLIDQVQADKLSELHNSLYGNRSSLRVVQHWKSIPAPERMLPGADPWRNCGNVYLMQRFRVTREGSFIPLPNGPHKIGATNRPWKKRVYELRNAWLRPVARYPTPVAFALENALHRHFREFHVKRPGSRELFRLPNAEVDGFVETVAQVERCVLVAEEARLGLEIMRLEAALKRAEAALR
jgi:hypothetical protein